jgi:trehalose 2-sulfotransferase
VNGSQSAPPALPQLLSPAVAGPGARFIESRLGEIFGPAALDPEGELTLDDLLGRKRACLLCMVPRSGSTYLGTLMRSTGQLGLAAEFLNLEDVPPSAQDLFRSIAGCDPIRGLVKRHRLDSLSGFLRHLIEHFSSPEGVFSIKGDFYQFLPLIRSGLIRKGLGKVTFVYLTREDVLAQAISAFRAIRSGAWSSLHTPRGVAEFDAEGILEQLGSILEMMRHWELLFSLLAIQPIRLTYEQITTQPAASVRALASALGVTVGKSPESPLLRQGDELSAEWADRIRTAASRYLSGCSSGNAQEPLLPVLEESRGPSAVPRSAFVRVALQACYSGFSLLKRQSRKDQSLE